MDTMDAARKGIVGNHNLSLPVAAKEWQTPASFQGKKRRQAHQTERKELLLPGQVECWATPTSRDHKDGADPSANVLTNCLLGRQAPRATGPASPQNSGRRRLNPEFVEWLMGWPIHHTEF
jgi:DNA (cytosine-5)-methyltransferase 1